MSDFYIKRNDTSPAIRYMLSPAAFLAGATVRFSMKDTSGAVKINNAAAQVYQENPGIVQYIWTAFDTDTPGLFEAEFEVVLSNGKIETYPNAGFITVQITADIA